MGPSVTYISAIDTHPKINRLVDYTKLSIPGITVGLVDADLLDNGTRHPNLALLKISNYFKSKGAITCLLTNYEELAKYDLVFVSCVFSYTKVPSNLLTFDNVFVGGTGFFEDGGPDLPSQIEHCFPDYELYTPYITNKISEGQPRSRFSDYLDYSIGFTTRGCPRKCTFCVNKKYSKSFRHSPIQEFLAPERPYIYLWDDNFLSFRDWEKILSELEETGKPFEFRQGLDIRILTPRKAYRLSNALYHGDFTFAFDNIAEKDLIEKKLRLWRSFTNRGTRCYVLCAFFSQDEIDVADTFERIAILMKYGCLPYVMRYSSYRTSKWRGLYTQIARWCNQPNFFKKKSFREFCLANEEYHSNKATHSSAYRAYSEFEREHPEIANKYFDLRYEEENVFGNHYIFFSDHDEHNDKAERSTPLIVFDEFQTDELEMIVFLSTPRGCRHKCSNPSAITKFLHKIMGADLKALCTTIERISPQIMPSIAAVPFFQSSIFDYEYVLKELTVPSTSVSPKTVGEAFFASGNKGHESVSTLGDRICKYTSILGLVYLTGTSKEYEVRLTEVGERFMQLNAEQQRAILPSLFLRAPIIRLLYLEGAENESDIMHLIEAAPRKYKDKMKKCITAILFFIYQQTK